MRPASSEFTAPHPQASRDEERRAHAAAREQLVATEAMHAMEGANWEEERESLRSEAESAREARQEAEAELRAVMGDGGPLKVLEGRLQVPCTLARVPRLCDSPPPRARRAPCPVSAVPCAVSCVRLCVWR